LTWSLAEVANLVGLQPDVRVDLHVQDLLGSLLRDDLDLDATFGGSDHSELLFRAVEHDAEVELALDVGARLDVDLAHELAGGAGLMGDERHAEDLAGDRFGFFGRLGELHAAALAAAAGVDLGLHHAEFAAEGARGFAGFGRGGGEAAFRDGHTEVSEQRLRLVLVNVHDTTFPTLGFASLRGA